MTSLFGLCASLVCTLPGTYSHAHPMRWDYPLDGPRQVVSAFAPPPASAPWLRGNRGVDLAAEPGAVVHAAGAGVVSFAGPLAGRGVVVVLHGELRSTYEPVLASVRAGDRVVLWQPIGRVQPAPSPCTPATCLHWGLLRDRTYLDPMLLLAGPVRLLPWSSGVSAPPRDRRRDTAPAWGPMPAMPASHGVGTSGRDEPGSDTNAAPARKRTRMRTRVAVRAAALGAGLLALGWWVAGRRTVGSRARVRIRGAPG